MASRWAIRIMKIFIFAIVFLAIFGAGFGAAVLYLWNWLMPTIFGLHTISYWQALGLLSLAWILFGGQRGWFGPAMHRRHKMRERWAHMSPEERDKFRAGMRGRCGGFVQPSTEPQA